MVACTVWYCYICGRLYKRIFTLLLSICTGLQLIPTDISAVETSKMPSRFNLIVGIQTNGWLVGLRQRIQQNHVWCLTIRNDRK